ncbi:hypothetical protein HK102_007005, partial [Quaeritorhiza haematococci]
GKEEKGEEGSPAPVAAASLLDEPESESQPPCDGDVADRDQQGQPTLELSEPEHNLKRRLGTFVRRGFFDRIKNAFKKGAKKVKEGFEKVGDTIKEGFEKVGDAIVDAGKAVHKGAENIVETIAEKALTHDISFDFKDNNKTSLNFFGFQFRAVCGDCEGRGSAKLSLDAEGLLSNPKVALTFEGELSLHFGFDIFITQPLNIFSKNLSLLEIPLGGFSVPNVLSVGPVFKIEMGAELAVLNTLSFHTGFDFEIPRFKATVGNLKKDDGGDATQSGFNPSFKARPLTFKDSKTTLQLRLAATPIINMGVSFLNNDEVLGAGIAFENAVFARASAKTADLIDGLREANLPERAVEVEGAKGDAAAAPAQPLASDEPSRDDREEPQPRPRPGPGAEIFPPSPPPSDGGACGSKPKATIDVLSQLVAFLGPLRHILVQPINKTLFEMCL